MVGNTKKTPACRKWIQGFEFYSESTLPGAIPSLEREMEGYKK